MKSEQEIIKLGYVIQIYLVDNRIKNAKPKDLMPILIEKGFFKQDHRNGLPLRNLLRELESSGKLYLIPQANFVQKEQNKFWYFNALKI
ncbi:hypothetical protein ACWBC2_16590 [Salegentibacter agarivorans]